MSFELFLIVIVQLDRTMEHFQLLKMKWNWCEKEKLEAARSNKLRHDNRVGVIIVDAILRDRAHRLNEDRSIFHWFSMKEKKSAFWFVTISSKLNWFTMSKKNGGMSIIYMSTPIIHRCSFLRGCKRHIKIYAIPK